MRYWINTVSRAHVLSGVSGGFTQTDHGKESRLRRLSSGDGIVFYSPRTDFPDGKPLQTFTALGSIADDVPYQVEINPGFRPWRRRVEFRSAAETPIQPLIEQLEFIPNKKQWGFPFRRGLFEIGASDFERIAQAMGAG